MTALWWVPVNDDIISHARNSKSWREVWERMGKPSHLLMPSFFLDEWRLYSQRSTLVTGIYMYLSNVQGVSVIVSLYIHRNVYSLYIVTHFIAEAKDISSGNNSTNTKGSV